MRLGRLCAAIVRIGASAALVCSLGAGSTADAASSSAASALASGLDAASWTGATLGGIDPKVFALALESASAAVSRGLAAPPSTLTVIDYSKPSTEPRMWVFD